VPLRRNRRKQRLTQLAIALGIAVTAAISLLVAPLNELIWAFEARLGTRPASGEIVMVGTSADIRNPSVSEQRRQLARALTEIDRAGADRVFIDLVFDKPGKPADDRALAQAIAALGDRAVLVRRKVTQSGNRQEIRASIPAIAGKARSVPSDRYMGILGITWTMPYRMDDGTGHSVPALPAALARLDKVPDGEFRINYAIDPGSIPLIQLDALDPQAGGGAAAAAAVRGKTVVVGVNDPSSPYTAKIPGYGAAGASYASILAAETLMRGVGADIPWWVTLLVTASVVLAGSLRTGRIGTRWPVASVLLGLFAVTVYAQVAYGVTTALADSLLFLAVFGALSYWSNKRHAQSMVDDLTGLANFKALEERLAASPADGIALVVAKVHRYEEVLSSLPAELHADYARQIAMRLTIADAEQDVFKDGGKYFALVAPSGDPEMLESHLKGLRAVLSQPLRVGSEVVDVGITFGIDASPQASPAQRIASATAAAEETTEALEPIRFHSGEGRDQIRWSISLQAKIDEALERRDIYVAYQPQLSLRTGLVTGAEALVRWQDPERGAISPAYFIEQCEQTGRMASLTQRVLDDSLAAAAALELAGFPLAMSINISATLLADDRIADMVAESVERGGIAAKNIVLEVTETARIADYDSARRVMERLRAGGSRLSIDDFGVGAASLEMLMRLPFDELKIDRMFVGKLKSSDKARGIVSSLLDLGRRLELSVVAEGVEDAETLDLLRQMGCDLAQGYHIARPLKFRDFIEFQKSRRLRAAQQG
jgi:EAL domain-containing protein (putative c-di-GMP-specific phosphodiesterase class I)/GGDEF domain-containing protein